MRYLPIGVAVRGIGHIKNGLPCQDKIYIDNMNGFTTIALADGAGSCKYSHYGAELVTKEITSIMRDNFDNFYQSSTPEYMVKTIIDTLKNKLESLANDMKCDINDLSSTLEFVTSHNNKIIIGQIGDGTIGAKKGGNLQIISQEDKNSAVNETFFVTSLNAYNKSKFMKGTCDELNALLIMSDGSENALVDKTRKNDLKFVPAINMFIDWTSKFPFNEVYDGIENAMETKIKNHTNDDCSIAIMVRSNESVLENKKIAFETYGVNRQRFNSYRENLIRKLDTPCTKKYLLNSVKNKRLFFKFIKEMMKLGLIEKTNGLYKNIENSSSCL